MDEQESLHAAIHETVTLHDYDARWPGLFEAERERLFAALPGKFMAIEHIGSTAVPGLVAKPIIDLLAGVKSMAVGATHASRGLAREGQHRSVSAGASLCAAAVAEPLYRSGYTTSAEFNATLTDRKWFMRWAEGHRTHHLHVVVHNGSVWQGRLRFRDALRSNPQLAQQYADLKFQLARAHQDDREAYTDAKADFVRHVLSR